MPHDVFAGLQGSRFGHALLKQVPSLSEATSLPKVPRPFAGHR